MILINLLPHREAARKLKKERFYAALVLSALMGVLLMVLGYAYYQAAIVEQRSKNDMLKREIGKFDVQIKDIANLQAEIAALKARQQAVESLQSDRNMPVNLLAELVKQLPDGVYISSMRNNKNLVEIRGTAQSQDRISELIKNISTKSSWLSKPELIEITAGTVALSARDQRRVANFSMRMTLDAVPEPAKAASSAASAATNTVAVMAPKK